jgi:hypothetical protein
MIFWEGLGFVVAVIAFAVLILAETVSEKITGDDQFYQQHGWVLLIGLLVAAGLTYGLHRLLLLKKQRVLIDKETGEEVVLTPKHSLLGIPVQLWPVVFVALGLISAVVPRPQTSGDPNAAANANQRALSE